MSDGPFCKESDMKNMGTFDPSWNPVKPGGLSESEVAYLETLGWKRGKTVEERKDVAVGFADTRLPGRLYHAQLQHSGRGGVPLQPRGRARPDHRLRQSELLALSGLSLRDGHSGTDYRGRLRRPFPPAQARSQARYRTGCPDLVPST